MRPEKAEKLANDIRRRGHWRGQRLHSVEVRPVLSCVDLSHTEGREVHATCYTEAGFGITYVLDEVDGEEGLIDEVDGVPVDLRNEASGTPAPSADETKRILQVIDRAALHHLRAYLDAKDSGVIHYEKGYCDALAEVRRHIPKTWKGPSE